MDDEQELHAAFRLPETFAESGDPIEGNPYPTEHPAHQVWLDATRQAEMEVNRINSEASSLLAAGTITGEEWMLTQAVAKFDVWARRFVQVVSTDDALRLYDRWLVDYANAWIESLFLRAPLPPLPREMFLADLRSRLGARVHHWKAEARRYRVQQEAHAAAAPELQRRPSRELVERRRRAVWKYRDDHDLNATGFAQKVGISETVVSAIIREDWKRFKRGAQEKLLEVIGMTREDWYQE